MIAKITKKRERIMTTKEFIENPNRDANENSAEMTAQYETAGYELTDEELAAVTGGAFAVVI
ncbi:MAG: bacteriocin [Oscillospiraceae bacterium]|nr:bacteriocin [Oscillospiraceae bacterium]